MRALLFLAVLQIGPERFEGLLERLAEGWNQGEARKAAECFTEDAVYVEPPDRQLYRGREELYRFFGGDSGRPGAMSMIWRNVAFDEARQIGLGEFTFFYGSQVHGAVVIKLRDGRIHRWREYWYESSLPYSAFAGESAFVPGGSSAEPRDLLERLAKAWNESDADAAASLFSEDAVYLEPPEVQRFRGRDALRDFFTETVRIAPMKMTWHHLVFDPATGVGAGEYTFEWNGRNLHGIAWAQIEKGFIRRFREYQYPSELSWDDFVGPSAFPP
jgi:ketosteroid isomerase-like protein